MRSKKLWAAALATLLCVGAFFAFGLVEAVKQPIERAATVIVPDWPKGAPPIRVALLADIHLGNRAMSAARLRSIVGQVNGRRPDLVLIAGDFVVEHGTQGGDERAHGLVKPLAAFRAPLGVVSVLGNHDYWTAPDTIRAALKQAGAVVLENTAIRRGPLDIIGVSDAFSGHDDIAKSLNAARKVGGVPVVLTHTPDLVHKRKRGLTAALR